VENYPNSPPSVFKEDIGDPKINVHHIFGPVWFEVNFGENNTRVYYAYDLGSHSLSIMPIECECNDKRLNNTRTFDLDQAKTYCEMMLGAVSEDISDQTERAA